MKYKLVLDPRAVKEAENIYVFSERETGSGERSV